MNPCWAILLLNRNGSAGDLKCTVHKAPHHIAADFARWVADSLQPGHVIRLVEIDGCGAHAPDVADYGLEYPTGGVRPTRVPPPAPNAPEAT